MITIIDYGMGNIGSIQNILKKIGADSKITSNVDEILNAEKIILPGVGSFAQAMENLHKLNLVDAIREKAKQNTPLLGICLGMQLLASESEEGFVDGLNIIPGKVVKFNLPSEFKVPHMGWNLISYQQNCPLFIDFDKFDEVRYYFVHSYYYKLENSQNEIANCNYGHHFTCAVNFKNVFGVQFHPEKSHKYGMQLLKNFNELELC
jgi:glutamine amidotransferase